MKETGPWILLILAAAILGSAITVMAMDLNRYQVGQPVPAEVYTAPFDPCDPAYKFLMAPPADWTSQFGNNERTLLIHAVSELRVVVADQGRRLMALDERVKALEPVMIEYKGPAVFGIGDETKSVDPKEVADPKGVKE